MVPVLREDYRAMVIGTHDAGAISGRRLAAVEAKRALAVGTVPIPLVPLSRKETGCGRFTPESIPSPLAWSDPGYVRPRTAEAGRASTSRHFLCRKRSRSASVSLALFFHQGSAWQSYRGILPRPYRGMPYRDIFEALLVVSSAV